MCGTGKAISAGSGNAELDALVEIIRHHQRAILTTCRRWLHDRADVEDAAQETYLRLFRMSDVVRSNAAGLAYTCAVHVSIDINRRRSSRRRHETEAAAHRTASGGTETPHPMVERQLSEEVHAALQRLHPRTRDLVVQRYFLNRPQVDLAVEAGVSPSTLSRRLGRAMQDLRAHLRS